LGIRYQYEIQGYDLNGVWYLPDFWLPQYKSWVEIKGGDPDEDALNKAKLLASQSQRNVYVFSDIYPETEGYVFIGDRDAAIDNIEHFAVQEVAEPDFRKLDSSWRSRYEKVERENNFIFGFDLKAGVFWSFPAFWVDCHSCSKIQLWMGFEYSCGCCPAMNPYSKISTRLLEAYKTARQARFEHK
jgi:hypothetical protein